jgi:hypothetical protein
MNPHVMRDLTHTIIWSNGIQRWSILEDGTRWVRGSDREAILAINEILKAHGDKTHSMDVLADLRKVNGTFDKRTYPFNISQEDKYWGRVDRNGAGCWFWTGGIDANGYGSVWWGDQVVTAHRVAWYLEHDQWPTQYVVHECEVRRCVNPTHLLEVDRAERNRRLSGARPAYKKPAACIRGHYFTAENTYRPPKEPNTRQCKQCRSLRGRERRRQRKAATIERESH